MKSRSNCAWLLPKQILPTADLLPKPMPRNSTSATKRTRIILVVPDVEAGTPAVKTTKSPPLIKLCSNAADTAFSTTSSDVSPPSPVMACTPQLTCNRRTIFS